MRHVQQPPGPAGLNGADRPAYAALEGALGAATSHALLERSLTHRSFAYEHGGLPTNERLEFLGDAVLGLVVTDALYRTHVELPEGQLAKLRAAVVNMKALADVARTLGLGSHLRLGKGEEVTGGRDKDSILADTLEAVIGAVYLDRGLPVAAEVVRRHFDPLMAESARLGAGLDWKTSLQELTAAQLLGVPEYAVLEQGPDHAKSFTATAVVAGQPWGSGGGRSKKAAEQRAAEIAWTALQQRLVPSNGALPNGSVAAAAEADGPVPVGVPGPGALGVGLDLSLPVERDGGAADG